MYEDAQRKRFLMRDGTSFIDEFVFVEKSLNDTITPKSVLVKSNDTEVYKLLYGDEIGADPESCVDPLPPSHEHSDIEITTILDVLEASPRYIQSKDYDDRIQLELEFFEKTKNILFLLKIRDLIESFKQDGVVWGVGRGSSCSSLILYLLEVHDLNPLTYDISFSELSKEQDTDWRKQYV